MATFNQQHQKVGTQINGETVNVDNRSLSLVEKIDDLISQTGRAGDTTVTGPVVSYLQQARAASTNGDERRAVALLRKAAEVARPIGTIATAIAAVVKGAL